MFFLLFARLPEIFWKKRKNDSLGLENLLSEPALRVQDINIETTDLFNTICNFSNADIEKNDTFVEVGAWAFACLTLSYTQLTDG